MDQAGNLFIAELNDVVLRLDATTGLLTLAAGNGAQGYSGDNGPATSAQLNSPYGVAVDSAGNLYIADSGNNRIRKVSNGVISTVAGTGAQGYSGDNGPATSAQLNFPTGIALDSAGSLYIADYWNNRIRKVSNGVITTVAGNGTPGFSGDGGPATSAELSNPSGVALDAAGSLYIADTLNNRIRKVSNGVISTVAGNGTSGFSGDFGLATSAELFCPGGVALDAAGSLYIADLFNNRIRKVSNGVITTVAGDGNAGYSGDNGPATLAELNLFINYMIEYRPGPAEALNSLYYEGEFSGGIAVSSSGSLYIADTANGRIRKVLNGVITTVAGNGDDNGPATSAQLSNP
jgi:sugar lactone lactonase YvrE